MDQVMETNQVVEQTVAQNKPAVVLDPKVAAPKRDYHKSIFQKSEITAAEAKQLRIDAGLSTKQLSSLLGLCSTSGVTSIELGRRTITVQYEKRLRLACSTRKPVPLSERSRKCQVGRIEAHKKATAKQATAKAEKISKVPAEWEEAVNAKPSAIVNTLRIESDNISLTLQLTDMKVIIN